MEDDDQEMPTYNFCGCCDRDIITTIHGLVQKIKETKDSEEKVKLIQETIRLEMKEVKDVKEVKDCKKPSFFNGFVGITIDYLNRFCEITPKIENKYMEDVKILIKYCIKFLLIDETRMKGRYIALYSFIYDYLEIPDVRGFPYIVMQYMENKLSDIFESLPDTSIIDHGTAIRCPWLAMNRDLAIDMTQEIPEQDIIDKMTEKQSQGNVSK